MTKQQQHQQHNDDVDNKPHTYRNGQAFDSKRNIRPKSWFVAKNVGQPASLLYVYYTIQISGLGALLTFTNWGVFEGEIFRTAAAVTASDPQSHGRPPPPLSCRLRCVCVSGYVCLAAELLLLLPSSSSRSYKLPQSKATTTTAAKAAKAVASQPAAVYNPRLEGIDKCRHKTVWDWGHDRLTLPCIG